MKKVVSKLISFFIISFLILFFVVKDNYRDIINSINDSKLIYICIGFIIVLLGDFFRSLSISTFIKTENKEYGCYKGFLLLLQTNFFNGITPFSLGGQPFQLYSLKKDKVIGYKDGIKVIFKDFYSYQLALIILSSMCLVLNKIYNIVVFDKFTVFLIIMGYLLNFIIALLLLWLPNSNKNYNKIVDFIFNIFCKFKLIKNKNLLLDKYNNFIVDFKYKIKETLSDKSLVVKCVLFNMIKILSLGVSTYFCFKSLGFTPQIFDCVVLTIIVITMASFIPIPGSSGGVEYGFIVLFSMYLAKVNVNAALIIWRFLTYYLLIIIGGIMVVFKNKE